MRAEPAGPAVRLVGIPPAAMQAMVDGDVDRASRLAGLRLGEFLVSDDCTWLWRIRLEQARRDPSSSYWVARAAVTGDGEVVGHAGFHGPPDGTGMVEAGYTVDPVFRRRGYGRAMVRTLLAWASAEPRVTRLRASISPDNEASLATIRGFGFEQIGEQWDENDGLELVFEVRV